MQFMHKIICFFEIFRLCNSFSIGISHGMCKQTRLNSILSGGIDLSPSKNGGIMKRTILQGDLKKGVPKAKDTVVINWKIWLLNGTLAHSSSKLTEPFDFILGANPREVILGWEIAIPTMLQGELSELILSPEFAFGDKGALPMIPTQATIRCELELVDIIPHITRVYKSVGVNESIHDEILSSMQGMNDEIGSGFSVMDEVLDGRDTLPDDEPNAEMTSEQFTEVKEFVISSSSNSNNSNKMSKDNDKNKNDMNNENSNLFSVPSKNSRDFDTVISDQSQKKNSTSAKKFFNPATMKEDPNQQVSGQGLGHSWTENPTSLEVEIPLTGQEFDDDMWRDGDVFSKDDVIVSLKPTEISVSLASGRVLLAGPLEHRIRPSESAWALLGRDPGSQWRGQRVQLSLEKAHGCRQIWATVLNRDFLQRQRTTDLDSIDKETEAFQ